MKNILTLIITLFLAYTAQAQQPQITLQHNGSATFYTSATTAMTAAQDGDTLYFPGGSFGTLSIDKQLVIYGTGIHPDSTSATGVSLFSNIYFRENSSNSKIQGIQTARMYFAPNNQTNRTLEDIVVSRCYIYANNNQTSICLSLSNSYLDTLKNIQFTENIIKAYSNSWNAISYGSTYYENIYFNQ